MTIEVPYLPEEAIERDAEALLAEYARARGVSLKPPIPIEDIVEKHLKLRVDFGDLHQVLGVPKAGPEPDIFGAIWVDRREIVIDESLDPEEHPNIEGRYRFTLAHEGGGHWRLHRHYLESGSAQTSLFGGPPKPTVVCRSSEAKVRIEWQADYYASCLLMPRALLMGAWKSELGTEKPVVYELMKHTPLATRPRWNGPRSIGEILGCALEPPHAYLFDQVAKHFAPIFGVSVQAMRIRLEKLGLLRRDVPRPGSLAVGL